MRRIHDELQPSADGRPRECVVGGQPNRSAACRLHPTKRNQVGDPHLNVRCFNVQPLSGGPPTMRAHGHTVCDRQSLPQVEQPVPVFVARRMVRGDMFSNRRQHPQPPAVVKSQGLLA